MPMVTADRALCLWCMPKTASAYCECVLAEERGGYRVLDQHDPAWLRDREEGRAHALDEVPLHVGTIRDPWSWYASLWRHAFHHPLQGGKSFPRRPFASVLAYSGGARDFRSFLRGATHLDELELPYEWLGAIWVPRPGGPRPGRGLWSWAVSYTYEEPATGRCIVSAFIDGNRPADGLRALGCAATMPPRNTSEGNWEDGRLTDYTGWYDDEAEGWVRRADSARYEALGYGRPGEASRLGALIR